MLLVVLVVLELVLVFIQLELVFIQLVLVFIQLKVKQPQVLPFASLVLQFPIFLVN
jgi:hypothetical protein